MLNKYSGPLGTKCLFVLIVGSLFLSSCSSVHDLVPDSVSNVLPGKVEEEILTGERRAVLKKPNQPIEHTLESNAGPVIIPQAFTNANWAQPGGRPSNSLEHLALNTQPKRLWNVNAGTGSSNDGRLTASPIVVGNLIFVLDTRATVRAFSALNGKNVWSLALTPKDEEDDEGFGGGVAAEGGKVFAVTGFGTVAAIDQASGKKLWSRELGVPVRSAPTAKDGKVYTTTVNNEVFALSTNDGSTVWKFRGVKESAGLLGSTSPAIGGGFVIVPYSSGDIVAFRETDGSAVWTDSLTKTGSLSSLAQMNDISGRPVIAGGKVFAISHGGRFAALDLQTGKRIWGRDISGVQTPWVAGDTVFIVTLDNKVMAFSRSNGKVRWVSSLNNLVQNSKGLYWSGPVLAGGRLWLVSSKGHAVTLSPQTGKNAGSFSIGDSLFIPPVVANNTIYFLTDSAGLIAMR